MLEPSDEGFDTVRQIWNGDIQRRPAVIAGAQGPRTCWPPCASLGSVSCRSRSGGGGHAVAGHAVGDGGLMVDLSV